MEKLEKYGDTHNFGHLCTAEENKSMDGTINLRKTDMLKHHAKNVYTTLKGGKTNYFAFFSLFPCPPFCLSPSFSLFPPFTEKILPHLAHKHSS